MRLISILAIFLHAPIGLSQEIEPEKEQLGKNLRPEKYLVVIQEVRVPPNMKDAAPEKVVANFQRRLKSGEFQQRKRFQLAVWEHREFEMFVHTKELELISDVVGNVKTMAKKSLGHGVSIKLTPSGDAKKLDLQYERVYLDDGGTMLSDLKMIRSTSTVTLRLYGQVAIKADSPKDDVFLILSLNQRRERGTKR